MLEIVDFPHDNNFWKVEWLGGVYNDMDGEPRIRIYLTQIKPNIERKHTLSNTSLETFNNQYISSVHDIKIGLIQFVTIGSVWRNGIRDISFTSQYQQFTFNSDTEREVCYQHINGSIAETGLNHTTEWNNHLTNRYYLITNSEARSAGNYLNVFYDTNNLSRIYIPSIVIFQSCYVTSPKAARHIIFGQIGKLLDLDSSGFINNKTFRIHLHRDFKDIEAPMIANIATNLVAKIELRTLRQSLLKESNSIETPYPKRIKISFPFSKEFSLKVKGKYIMDNNKAYGFLVTEIIEFITEFEFSKLIILRKNSNQTHICYCHTPIRYAWDLYDEYTSSLKQPKKFLVQQTLKRLRKWDIESLDRVDYFIANSKFVQKRISKTYNRDSVVIYPPVDTKSFILNENKSDFYLTACRLVPYKKTKLIVEAFNEMPNKKLIVIGDGDQLNKIKEGATDNIIFKGYLDSEEVSRYIQKAKGFIQMGIEGFGIATIEAQACGTPIIAFAGGGVLETVIDQKTGVYFHQQSSQALEDAIEKFEKIKFEPSMIRENALKFSNTRFEKEMDLYIKEKIKFHNLNIN